MAAENARIGNGGPHFYHSGHVYAWENEVCLLLVVNGIAISLDLMMVAVLISWHISALMLRPCVQCYEDLGRMEQQKLAQKMGMVIVSCDPECSIFLQSILLNRRCFYLLLCHHHGL